MPERTGIFATKRPCAAFRPAGAAHCKVQRQHQHSGSCRDCTAEKPWWRPEKYGRPSRRGRETRRRPAHFTKCEASILKKEEKHPKRWLDLAWVALECVTGRYWQEVRGTMLQHRMHMWRWSKTQTQLYTTYIVKGF